MHINKLKNTFEHILAHLRLVKLLPLNPDPDSVRELQRVDDLIEDLESILEYIRKEEILEN